MPDDVTCPRCLGWGFDDDDEPCPLCGGAGEVSETTARKAQAEARAARADLEDER